MSSGKVVQVIGAVVDVEFPRDQVPKVYDALKIDSIDLTLEVQQQLGDGVVRAIAMGPSEGLARGVAVSNTGNPITVPVGAETLGRIMDVLGNAIDERGPINAREHAPIHRAAPTYEEQKGGNEILETGIKVIDLICPFARGGKVGLFGGAGVGKTVTMASSSATSLSSTRASRCSPAWASAHGKATTSITRWQSRTCSTNSRSCTAR